MISIMKYDTDKSLKSDNQRLQLVAQVPDILPIV